MTMTHDATGNPLAPWEQSDDDDDLEDRLPTRRLSWLSGLLAILVVGGGAFLGGVQVQKHHDKGLTTVSSSTTGTAGRSTSGTGAGTAGGTGAGRGFGAGTTVGSVKLVDGSTIYVTDTSGNTVTVNTTSASTYTKSESVALKDIQPGDTVIIRGPTQADGTVDAASVTDSGAAGTGFGGFGGRFGGGGTRSGGTGTGTGATGTGGTGANG